MANKAYFLQQQLFRARNRLMLRARDSAVEQVLMVVLDMAALLLASNLAFDLRYCLPWANWFPGLVREGPAPWGALYQAMPYMFLSWFIIYEIFGLYQPGLERREELVRLIKAQGMAFVVLFSVAFFYRGFSYSRLAALLLVPLAFVLTLGFRQVYRVVRESLLRLPLVRERVLLVGCTDETRALAERLAQPDNPFQPIGILTGGGAEAPPGLQRLGEPAELGRLLTRQESVDRVLLVSAALAREELLEAIDTCERHRVHWQVVPALYDLLMDKLRLDQVAGIPVMGPAGTNLVGLNLAFKRLVDILVSVLLLLVLSPLIALVALLVKISSPGPVLFVQQRAGRGGKPFGMLKFRTMYTDVRDKLHRQVMEKVIGGEEAEEDKHLYKLPKDPRITPVGKLLRRFSLDELPQLWNVLRGEMSLVGPRPAIPYEVKLYRPRHHRRLEVLPGITGLWQVSGRNRLSFEEMIELDIQYIENWTPTLDLRIFLKTLVAVLLYRGY